MNDKPSIPVLVQPAAGLALPAQLAEQAADAVRELLAEAAAENTTRSYATALRYWAGWFAARYGRELTLPVPEAAVLQFVVDHVQRRSADGGLTWELPVAVDQTLVAAGLKADRKTGVEGKSVSGRVDLGGRRILKKKKIK